MKFRYIVLILFLVFALSVPVYAAELEGEGEGDIIQDVLYVPSVVTLVQDPDYSFEVLIKSPVTPSSTTGLKSIMLSLLGNYDVIVGEYTYQNTNGTTSYLREMQPDYVWLVSAGIFAIVLYSLFRLGGGLVCRI